MMSSQQVEYNLVHAQNLVINDPVALIIGEQSEYTKEQLLETVAVLRLYLGKTIEVAELYRLENNNIKRMVIND